ncbi:hypothetical protein VTO42DRAFT_5736 [Malbranchea cinnamomea]
MAPFFLEESPCLVEEFGLSLEDRSYSSRVTVQKKITENGVNMADGVNSIDTPFSGLLGFSLGALFLYPLFSASPKKPGSVRHADNVGQLHSSPSRNHWRRPNGRSL